MATKAPKAIIVPTPRIVSDAMALAARFRNAEGLHRYAVAREPLLKGASAALVVLGLACGAGAFMFIAGLGSWLVLPAMALSPLVALASLFVLFHVFFSWVEARALAHALGRRGRAPGAIAAWLRRKLGIDLGPAPALPWPFVGGLVVLPLALLAAAAPLAGAAAILLAFAAPLAYARLDR